MFICKSISSIVQSSSKCHLKIRGYSYMPPDLNRFKKDVENDKEKAKRELKKWRKEPPKEYDPLASMLDFSESFDNQLYAKTMPTKPTEFSKWYRDQQTEYVKWSQRYIAERQATLGKDLAITHYICHRGGRIRRKGLTKFIEPKDFDQLPSTYDPLWLVEEVDASGIPLYYDALDNFKDLNRLKIVSFSGNPNFDDWCLERILAICPNIHHLDVSDCEKVTERGLEGLYRNLNLKNLIITDHKHTASFELTVLLLEDSRPDLNITVKKPTVDKAQEKQ
ncbi:distal membrane-arm assembly complex protein 2 [Aphidius gifuensis]|uniref:distal membrane-arm assembly complex protein 2 n=1 Tax=Aphidius gifuensis TaxID=684658 RepID=UPI001CDB4BAC|nr:distal membrane-arm assembly complex protein 2 [Aphidius gifuensis]